VDVVSVCRQVALLIQDREREPTRAFVDTLWLVIVVFALRLHVNEDLAIKFLNDQPHARDSSVTFGRTMRDIIHTQTRMQSDSIEPSRVRPKTGETP